MSANCPRRNGSTLRRSLVGLVFALFGLIATGARGADIDVKVIHFGTGDVLRGGGTTAVLVEFRSALDGPVELEAVWELPNADRDIAEYSRKFVLNPGQATRRWIYGVLPPLAEGMLRDEVYDLRLFALEDGERARDLGTAKIAPRAPVAETEPQFLSLDVDAFAVVGPRSYGLDIFEQTRANGVIPSMNTATVVGKLRDESAFPDRWEGLAQFDVLVWGGSTVPPTRLAEDGAQAILEWVERGGNFIIALPAAGDPWSIGTPGRHALSGILPSTAPTRVDDVLVSSILPMLSVQDALRQATARTRLAIFDPKSLDPGWRPFLAVPARRDASGAPIMPAKFTSDDVDGAVIGIRREYGFGHITLLGLDVEDLAARGLQSPAIPEGDVFWNRLLGRRADTPNGAEYTALEDSKRLAGGGYTPRIGSGETIAEQIGMAGQATVGVLAATAVFGLYWLIAGPFGFALLKMFKREKWAWVAYVCVAAVFSIGIWAIGRARSGAQAVVQHMTVLDMVERAPGEADPTAAQWRRATSWFSLFAPNYGTTRVELDPATDGRTPRRNLLTSWRSVDAVSEGFPNRERYVVGLDAPNAVDAPSRATSIDFRAEWLGALEDGWGSLPSAVEPVSSAVDRSEGLPRIVLNGRLTHKLPAPLEDVLAIHIWPARNPLTSLKPAERGKPPERRFPGQLPNRGAMVAVPTWNPGQEIDLGTLFPPAALSDRLGLDRQIEDRYYTPIYRESSQFGFNMVTNRESIDLRRDLEMLSIFGMLEPPAYLQNPPTDPNVLRISRLGNRALDLSDYFTQPCLIIMGWMQAELPYPLRIDGEEVPSVGRVLVRWIQPLPGSYESVIPERIPRAPARTIGGEPRDAGDGDNTQPEGNG